MNNFCVFAGTTEGRKLVEFLITKDCMVTACVATEYGSTMLASAENLTVIEKRLDQPAMEILFNSDDFDLVIDATHPYAAVVTENIKKACTNTRTSYVRLQRDPSGETRTQEDLVYVPDTVAAADFLDKTEGNILLTTGSKELKELSRISGFAERAYARILPMEESLKLAEAAGLKTGHIIAMQGPFSEKMNLALIESVHAQWLLTKDTGTAGGFTEKASAALKSGVRMVVIGRPPETGGRSFGEVIKLLQDLYGYEFVPKVTIVGIGPGSAKAMTGEVREAIGNADCLIGAGRMLEAVKGPGQPAVSLISPGQISDYIHEHKEYTSFAVVMSGDSGFFSGTKKLLPLLERCSVKVLPGLSSLSVMAAALGLSYEETLTVSVHGRDTDVIPDIRAHRDVFILTGGDPDIRDICERLEKEGLQDVRVHVGERLSYPDQKITSGTPADILKGRYEKLSVLWVENPHAVKEVFAGLPDDRFIRGEGKRGLVPMTKSEVRAVCISKLALHDRCVCWDVGAGTGSVSVEMALNVQKGHVHAVEKDADAVRVMKQNIEQFHLKNLTLIEGTAPEALNDLPAPDRVFIGGSSGGLKEIIALAREKNPMVRIVATSVTLESEALLTECLKEFEWKQTDVISVNISASRKAGAYNLMTAQNPIYIYTMSC